MPNESLNRLQENLVRLVTADGDGFEAAFGRTARHFLDRLPVLFPIMRRAALDLSLPAEARRLAALAVVYVAEPDDFMSEAQFGARSMLDDCWVLFSAFAQLRTLADDERLRALARVAGDYDDVVALSENVVSLSERLPSKVHERLITLIARDVP